MTTENEPDGDLEDKRRQPLESDTEEFKRCYEAAVKGDVKAQTSIGAMFEDGAGVEQDYNEAIDWYYAQSPPHITRLKKAQCKLGIVAASH